MIRIIPGLYPLGDSSTPSPSYHNQKHLEILASVSQHIRGRGTKNITWLVRLAAKDITVNVEFIKLLKHKSTNSILNIGNCTKAGNLYLTISHPLVIRHAWSKMRTSELLSKVIWHSCLLDLLGMRRKEQWKNNLNFQTIIHKGQTKLYYVDKKKTSSESKNYNEMKWMHYRLWRVSYFLHQPQANSVK